MYLKQKNVSWYKTHKSCTSETHENWTERQKNVPNKTKPASSTPWTRDGHVEVFCVVVPNQFSSINGVETWNFSHIHSPGAERGRF